MTTQSMNWWHKTLSLTLKAENSVGDLFSDCVGPYRTMPIGQA